MCAVNLEREMGFSPLLDAFYSGAVSGKCRWTRLKLESAFHGFSKKNLHFDRFFDVSFKEAFFLLIFTNLSANLFFFFNSERDHFKLLIDFLIDSYWHYSN